LFPHWYPDFIETSDSKNVGNVSFVPIYSFEAVATSGPCSNYY